MEKVKLLDGRITLIRGDCLEIMPKMKSGIVDAIIVDLPYGTTQNRWDSIIPLDTLWKEYKRLRKSNAPAVMFAAQPFTAILTLSNIEEFKYDWVWKKPKGTGHLNAKKMPMRDKEDILVFYTKPCVYNPQMGNGTPYKNKAGKNHDGTDSMTDNYGAYTNFRYDNEGTRYPKQVLNFGVVERGTVHPTQKPVELMEYLIRTYTNENDLVMDNTMGSGTTAVACINTSRRFVGIEKEQEYFDICIQRCTDAIADRDKKAAA